MTIKSAQTIEIKQFVELAEIDPMFFGEPYFLAPEKGGDRAYGLLRDALSKAGKVGISKLVLRTREHLAAVKAVGKALVLELMHFAEELADPGQLALPSAPSDPKEMQMAFSLVDAMTDEWKPEEYHDQYAAALMKVIEEKVAAGGKELPPVKRGGAPSTKVVDIVQMLQESLRNTGKKAKSAVQSASKPKKAARRKAA